MVNVLSAPLKTPDPDLRKFVTRKLDEMLAANPKIVYIDADLMRAMASRELWDKYPGQVFNAGIAEANMVGVGAGLSSEGFVPFLHSFAAFNSRRVADQVFMSCAYSKLNVKIIGSDPGICAQLNGGTHTANEDIAIMRSLPNMTIVDVCDSVMVPQVLEQAAGEWGNYYIRIPRGAVPRVYADNAVITIGKAETLKDGNDATIIACGIEVYEAVRAGELLEEKGIHVRVIDMHTIQPLDKDMVIRAAKETGAIVTAENHNYNGGLGSAVAECLAENCPIPMERVANGSFGDVGTLGELKKRFGLSAEFIADKVLKVLERR